MFGYHVLGLLIVVVYSFVGSWLLLKLTAKLFGPRVKPAEEQFGLDFSQHEESTYHIDQEFEQTYQSQRQVVRQATDRTPSSIIG